MAEWEKVIKGLEKLREYADSEVHPILSPDNWGIYSELRDLIDEAEKDVLALLKAQNLTVEPKLLELEDETKAWLDEMDAVDALGNIANICMDFDGYRTANGLGELINEVRTYAKYCADKLKAREQQHGYETSIGMVEYCERYESTYNPEDGSM